ncbi:MAG: tetratricopeptide repeat protein [Opitutales bacterium]
MKYLLSHPSAALFAATCLLLAGITPLRARNPEHLDVQFITISGYLDQGEYERGLVLVDLILDTFAPTSLDELGPSFGRFFYLKGLFLLATERYEDAAENFAICHKNFANRGALSATKPNPFVDEAIVRHISCLMALERYEEAAALFSRVDSAGLENTGDLWAWSLNRGLAMIRTGRERDGVEHLQNILKNTENPDITPSMRMEVIQLLAFHWADLATMEELRDFMKTFRPFYLAAPASDRRTANPVFLDTARRAYDDGHVDRCLMWLGFFDFAGAVADAKAEPSGTGETRSRPEEILASHLSLTAAVYLQLENPLGAIPAFEELTIRFPEHGQAAEHRYNLALTLVSAGLLPEALAIAKTFRNDFPESSLVPDLESTLLHLLLATHDLDETIAIARDILSRETTDDATETAAYALGIAFYRQERISEAEEALDAYAGRFSNGEHREQALYYLAACKYQLGKFDEAAQNLEDFVHTYRDGDLTSAALLLQARTFKQTGKNDEALARLQKILDDYPASPETAAANLLAAEITAASGASYHETRRSYEQTRQSALESNDPGTAREALKQLLYLAADAGDATGTAEYYEIFFAETEYSAMEAVDVLDAAWKLLCEAGRKTDVLERIETLLLTNGVDRKSPALTPLVEVYRKVLEHSPADFSPLTALAEAEDTPQPLQASLLMARIDLPEDGDQTEKDKLYNQLTDHIPGDQMSTYVITRLSRHYQQQGEQVKASELRDYLLETRSKEPGFEYVLFDEAQLGADSDDPEIRNASLQNFEQVADLTDDPELIERTRLGIARIHTRNEQWEKAQEAWGTYLSNRNWVFARAEANFEYARSLEEGGNPRQALGYYVSIYSNFEKQYDWSSRAYLRAALIMDAQGKRREALLILQDMMRRMHQVDHPVVERAKKQFNQWKNEFTQSP